MATTVVTIIQTGASQVVVPTTAKRATVETTGAGSFGDVSGGGGGAYSKTENLIVSGGQTINIVVGEGGMSNVSGAGDTWAFGRAICLAKGGAGTQGGRASQGAGDIRYSGANASGNVGGSSAHPLGDGFGQAGSNPDQGSGGASTGSNGSVPGGGGFRSVGGARGQVRITYTDEAIEPSKAVAFTNTVSFRTAGAGSWTAPVGVTKIQPLEVWAGGGSGDDNNPGGGGAYSRLNNVSLTARQVVSFSVGGATADTWAISTSTLRAKGGAKPQGGQASAGIGDIRYSGGNALNGNGGGAANPFGDGVGSASIGPAGSPNEDGGGGGVGQRAAGKIVGAGGGLSDSIGATGQVRITYVTYDAPSAPPLNVNADITLTPVTIRASGSVIDPQKPGTVRTVIQPTAMKSFANYSGDYPDAISGANAGETGWPWVGQYLQTDGSTYEINQAVLTFDTSGLPKGQIVGAQFVIQIHEALGENTVEVRAIDSVRFIPALQLANQPLVATVTMDSVGAYPVMANVSRTSSLFLSISSRDQRLAIPPASPNKFVMATSGALIVDVLEERVANADITLPPVSLTANGSVAVSANANITLSPVVLTASATVEIAGAADLTLPAVTLDATATVEINGGLNLTLPPVVLEASATTVPATDNQANLNIVLPPVILTASGKVEINGGLDITLPALTLDATASVEINGGLDVMLDPVTLIASGTVREPIHYVLTVDERRMVVAPADPRMVVAPADDRTIRAPADPRSAK